MSDIEIEPMLSEKQAGILRHAWGFHANKAGYRSHYCAEIEDENVNHLKQLGYLEGPFDLNLVGSSHGMFYLTPKAIALLKDWKILGIKCKT
jgi:hypothetical protein